eukprot:scaffold22634_cov123-Cylindrotheca_fusiformis.AAC.3
MLSELLFIGKLSFKKKNFPAGDFSEGGICKAPQYWKEETSRIISLFLVISLFWIFSGNLILEVELIDWQGASPVPKELD